MIIVANGCSALAALRLLAAASAGRSAAGSVGPSDLMYSISCRTSSSVTRPWKVGITGWIAGHDLGLGLQDRFADISFVGLSPCRRRRVAPCVPNSPPGSGSGPSHPACGSCRRPGLSNSFCAVLGQRSRRRAAAQPGLVILRLHHVDPADHAASGWCRSTRRRTGDTCPALVGWNQMVE